MHLDSADNSKAVFNIQMVRDTWLGLALGSPNMTPGTDLWQISGTTLQALDKISSGYMSPSSDGVSDLDAQFVDIGNNLLEVTIVRSLDTSDSQDYVLPAEQEFNLGWAIKTTSAIMSSKHDKAGSFVALLEAPTQTGEEETNTEETTDETTDQTDSTDTTDTSDTTDTTDTTDGTDDSTDTTTEDQTGDDTTNTD